MNLYLQNRLNNTTMKSINKYLFIAFLILSNFAAFAQGEQNDTGDLQGNDAPAAPINAKLIYLLVLGIAFVFYTLKRKKAIK